MKVKSMTITEGAIHRIENYSIYRKDALLIRCGSYIYNVPKSIYDMAH